jgi:class 3 adenylate cyclase/tetratricopeptide (TPR) repeat protein
VERKVVTTLFCDIVGYTALCERLDPEEADRLLRTFYSLARSVIETWGGLVEKFVGDAVLGVFGVPTAHEDDAERAVATALRLRDRLQSLHGGPGIQARVGVNTGPAVVRLDAVASSGQGFLVGDAVNTAARLQQLAPPMGVVVGAATHDLTAQRFVYEPLPTATVKGKRGTLSVWLAQGPVSRMGVDLGRTYPAALVDREVELGVLRGLLKKARTARRPQFALLVGEAGIGKSRLLFELARYLDGRPYTVYWRQGRCPAYGDGLTFWALAEIVRQQLGVWELDEPAAVEARLAATLAGEGEREWLATRLRPLLGLDAPSASRDENFAAWRRFLEVIAADSPAVLAFEDLQWASDATLEFLDHLIENLGDVPLLLLGTARPDLFEAHPQTADRIARLVSAQRVARLELRPLTETETDELVARLTAELGELVGRAGTRAAIARRSTGNPLFAEQLTRHVAAAAPTASPQSSDTTLLERVGAVLPESLQSLIAARLDGLPPARKVLLGDAAVVGEVFWTGAVAALDHDDREAAEQGLAELVRRDLVLVEATSSIGGEREFAFRHNLIRDVAYGQLTRADRAAKHAAVARWVEATAGERIDELAEILAHHYVTALELAEAAHDDTLAAELRDPTVRALELAGARALPLDVQAAERHYARAVELAGDGPRRPHLLVAWAEALKQSGRLEAAAQALDEGIAGLSVLGDDAAKLVASAAAWDVHWLLGDEVMPSPEAGAVPWGDEASAEHIPVLEEQAARAVHVGDNALAIELAERVIATGHRLGLPESQAALEYLGMARCTLGRADGLIDLRRAAEIARSRGTGHALCASLSNLGEFVGLFDGPAAALEFHRESLELARPHHDELAACFSRELVLVDLVWSGRWDEAQGEASAIDALLAERNDVWDLQMVRATLALLNVWRGDVDTAAEQAAWAERRSRETPLPAVRAACLISLASVAAARGERAAALRLLDLCRPLTSAAGLPDFALRMPEAIRLATTLGDPGLAADLAGALPADRPYDGATAAMHHALLAESRADHASAVATFADAADRWNRLGVPYERAQALLGQARTLVRAGATRDARSVLKQSRDIFTALGARLALIETETLLSSFG